ncbi:MAG: GntR family transcriptional regulator [Actinomycetes bacterium]
MAAARSIQPVERESTPSIIARQLRAAISSGELAPGTQLGEAELARELGVSRGPLREAMQRLSQEGLLVSIRNRGLFVVELSEDDVRDIYVARTAVERAAAAEIIRLGPARPAARLTTVVKKMARAAARGEAAKVGEADLEFHELLVQLAQSPRLARMHQTLLTETRMCIVGLQGSYETGDHRVEEHLGIVDALKRKDEDLVNTLLAEHMQDALRRLGHGVLLAPSAS